MATRASSLSYKTLAAYFTEGSTWSRLRDLATSPTSPCKLFKDCSSPCKEFFGTNPSAIVDNRPAVDLEFLKFLEGKEHHLHTLATKDLEQRTLKAETREAILELGNINTRIHRRILQELFGKMPAPVLLE